MRVEYGCWANCSESVMRFYTLDPKQIQFILQAIADEVSNAYLDEKEIEIPLFKTAEEYDTNWNKEMSYHGKVREKYDKQIAEIWKQRDEKKISQEETIKRYGEIQKEMGKIIYPNSLISACAGLGDNEAVVTIEKKKNAFRLNIGNNDISDNKTDWIGKVTSLGIKVQEAEFSKELSDLGRDCCCGISYFDDYENLIKDKKMK